jgi:hypothetical protein
VIGYAHFDEPDDPQAGWAASPATNGEPKRVAGIQHLRSDIVWLTNVEYSAWWKYRLGNQPNLRQALYARTTIKALMADLGMAQPQHRAEDICAALYEVLTRTMRTAERAMGFKVGDFSHQKMSEAIKLILLGEREPREYACSDNAVVSALAGAIQSDSSCGAKKDERTKHTWVGVRRNRVQHALDILASPVPMGPWEVVPMSMLPASGRERVAWVLSQSRPVLARISMTGEDSDQYRMVAFGVSSVQKTGSRSVGGSHMRQWVASPEMAMLASFCSVEVHDVLLASSYAPIAARYPFPTVEPHDWFSLSFGLFAENYWSSLIIPTKGSGPGQDSIHTARAVWLRAVDRVYSFHAAMQMRLSGVIVSQYGNGAVGCWVPEGGLAHIQDAARRAGLLAPLLLPQSTRLEQGLEAAA